MKIALYGIGGTYNFGCDAIVRGTEKIIHNRFPDADIDYYSYDYQRDCQRLQDVNVRVIPMKKGKFHGLLSKIAIKEDSFLRKLNLSHNDRFSCIMLFAWVTKYDYILSVGGDIYTLPPVSERNNAANYTNPLLEFDKYCTRKHKKNIIWGASIGPFEESPEMKKVFLNHLQKNVYKICVREEHSLEYLKKNKIENVDLYADPSFALSGDVRTEMTGPMTIGINLSPLASGYAHKAGVSNERLQKQADSILTLSRKFGCSIMLIPHVYSDYDGDNDYLYLQRIYEKLQPTLGDRVELVRSNSFLDTKKELIRCSICISARMHCAVNAITSGVPTIFLSYSEKSKGMCKMVYGHERFVMDISQMEQASEIQRIVGSLLEEMPQMQEKMMDQVQELHYGAMDSAQIMA